MKRERSRKRKIKPARGVIDGRLVREGMRRLRTVGLIGLAVIAVVMLCELLAGDYGFSSYSIRLQDALYGTYADNITGTFMSALLSIVSLRSLYIILVPVMMLILFGHVNRRAESDLFASMPVKKRTLFCSYALAVLLWALLLIVIYSVLEAVICQYKYVMILDHQMNGTYNADYETELGILSAAHKNRMLGMLSAAAEAAAGSVLVLGAFAVGMASTGTYTTNIAAALIILLAPSVLVQSMLSNLKDVGFLDITHGWLKYAGTVYNVFANVFVGGDSLLFGSVSEAQIFWLGDPGITGADLAGCVYSLLLGAAYTILGCLLFTRRQSEIAEKPALNPVWRTIIRLVPTVLLFVVGANRLVSVLTQNESEWVHAPFSCVLWFAAGIAFYILFELLMTKNIKATAKSLVWLPIAPIVAGIVGLSTYGIMEAAARRIPDTDEVVSVRMEGFYSNYKPFSEAIGKETLTSEAVKEKLLACLETEVADFRSGRKRSEAGAYPVNEYAALGDVMIWDAQDGGYVSVRFETEDGGFWRRVPLDETQTKELLAAFSKEETMREMQVELYDMSSYVGSGEETQLIRDNEFDPSEAYPFYCGCIGWNLSGQQLLEIYDTYREEVRSMDAQYRLFLGQEYHTDGVFEFLQDIVHDVDFPIGVDTPETTALLCNLENERSSYKYDLDEMIALVNECNLKAKLEDAQAYAESNGIQGVIGDFDEVYVELAYIYYDSSEGKLYTQSRHFATDGETYGSMGVKPDELEELRAILKPHENEEITLDQDAIMLTWKGDSVGRAVGHWYNLTDEEAARICELLPMIDYIRSGYEQYNYY